MLSIIFSGIVLWYCEQMYMNRSHYSLVVTIAGIVEVGFFLLDTHSPITNTDAVDLSSLALHYANFVTGKTDY